MAKAKRKIEPPVADNPATPDVDESMEDVPAEEEAGVTDAEVEPEAAAEGAEVVTEIPADDDSLLDENKFIAVDSGGTGSYEIRPLPPETRPRTRAINLHGKSFEHVGEYRGVWAYRHLG